MPSPLVSIHLAFALGALLLGPFALWARKGSRGHRAAGYACVTLMLGAADTAMHRRFMQGTYIGGCIVAGLFALAPRRYLGSLLWNEWLGGTGGLFSQAVILAHTPGWVFGLLAALLALGVSQCFARDAARRRLARATAPRPQPQSAAPC